MGRIAPDRWKLQYFRRIKDLIDRYQPDLLYTDRGIPFDEYGYSPVAEVYNVSAAKPRQSRIHLLLQNGQRLRHSAPAPSTATRRTRWHLTHPMADRHLHRRLALQTRRRSQDPQEGGHLLVDIVSKNGNLLLNFPLPNSGRTRLRGARGPRRHHPHGWTSTAKAFTPLAPGRSTAKPLHRS
jgi:alpha-L-fucosidase